MTPLSSPLAIRIAVFGAVVLLSLLAVFNQVKALGLSWQETHYTARLEAVLHGDAGSPWQYRLLSDAVTVAVYRCLEAVGVPRPVGVAFVGIRIVQNIVLLLLALYLYRLLGIGYYLGLLGAMALAWAMTQTNYNSDLSINLYSENILYLLAAIAVLRGRALWLPCITLVAALNRETSGLIPCLALAALAPLPTGVLVPRAKVFQSLTAGLAIYGVVFVLLRLVLGARGWELHPDGAVQGWSLFVYNLGFLRSWVHLGATFGILPLLAFAGWRDWPRALQIWCVVLVPVWFVVHFFYGAVAETRLFLVPLVLVFTPGALFAVQASLSPAPREALP